MKHEKRVAVYEVWFDAAEGGTDLVRFGADSGVEARAFAALRTLYGNPCPVSEPSMVPVQLARRWGLA